MTDEDVLEYFNKWKCIPWKRIEDKYKEYLLNRFDDLTSKTDYLKIKESTYRLQHHTENFYCSICGKPRKFKYQSLSYYKTCGNKECINEYSKITFSKHYDGLINNFQRKEIIEKIENTKIEKYNDPKYNNRIKFKETSLKKYNVDNPNKNEIIRNKIKETNINKYGVSCSLLSNNAKEKTKKTNIQKYGYEHYQSSDKFKTDISIKLKNKTKTEKDEINKKRIRTIYKKYGVNNIMNIPGIKAKFNWDEIIQKQYKTKKINGTLGGPHSKMEETSYLLIKDKFNDVIRQYIDEKRYPFACDFYIPSLDLFIECQYYPTHGKHPYNLNNTDDIEYAKYLSNTKFGSYTWTVRDVNKRNIAKQNNLNYLEFFTILELEQWLNKIDNE